MNLLKKFYFDNFFERLNLLQIPLFIFLGAVNLPGYYCKLINHLLITRLVKFANNKKIVNR